MTDRERLEEIDQIVDDLYSDRIEIHNFVQDSLEQTKQVQELEEYKESYWGVVRALDNMSETLVDCEEQNKCYREALEFYANKKTYKYYKESYIDLLKDGGCKARKALDEFNNAK